MFEIISFWMWVTVFTYLILIMPVLWTLMIGNAWVLHCVKDSDITPQKFTELEDKLLAFREKPVFFLKPIAPKKKRMYEEDDFLERYQGWYMALTLLGGMMCAIIAEPLRDAAVNHNADFFSAAVYGISTRATEFASVPILDWVFPVAIFMIATRYLIPKGVNFYLNISTKLNKLENS